MSDEETATPAPKKEKPKSRSRRWADAAGAVLDALGVAESAVDDIQTAVDELRAVQEEYEEWKDNLPENLVSSNLGDKLEEVCGLDIESITQGIRDAIDDAKGVAEEAKGVELPQGFGRD